MEVQKEKKLAKKNTSPKSDVPSAPTMDDFYIDPGIGDAAPPASDTGLGSQSEKALSPAFSDPLGATAKSDPYLAKAPPPPEDHETESSNSRISHGNFLNILEHTEDQKDLQYVSPHHTVKQDLQYISPHHAVQQDLQNMSPHQLLQKDLNEMSLDCEPSAPQKCEQPRGELFLEASENHFGEKETDRIKSDIAIVPFTDSQLHALYHNVELEKNMEFVDHWLDTQNNIEKFQLDEMLVNYLRVRTMLGTSKHKYDLDRAHVDTLSKELWVFSSDTIEEEGECEDGNIAVVTRDSKVAEYSDSVAQSLRSRLKQCKETLTEDYSLHCFRSEVPKVRIDEFLHSVIVRQQGGIVERTLVYSTAEEVRLSVSVLFKFLRKDIQDKKMVRDLKQWLDRMVAVVLF